MIVLTNSLSVGEQIFISIISGIAGSIITVIITLILYYKDREEAKKNLLFDISFKELFSLVYKPILDEYYRYVNSSNENVPYTLNVNFIEKAIFENYTIIKFAPKGIRVKLFSLYAKCKNMNTGKKFEEKQGEILTLIEELKSEVEQNFKGYIDG